MAAGLSLFDGRLYPEGLLDADLETLKLFGVSGALVAPHLPPSPAKAKPLLELFDAFFGAQLKRMKSDGIDAVPLVGLPASSLPRRGLFEVLEALPRYLGTRGAALGPCGLLHGAPEEEDALLAQLKLARRLQLPLVVDAPKEPLLLRRILTLLSEQRLTPARVLVARLELKHVRAVLARGHFAGLSLHPEAVRAEAAAATVGKLGPERLLLSSEAGRGASDLLALARTERLMERSGLGRAVRVRALERNAREFLGLRAATP